LWFEYYQQQNPEEKRGSEFFERLDRRYHRGIITLLGVEDSEIAWLIYNQINGILLGRLWGNQAISFVKQMELLGEILTVYQNNAVQYGIKKLKENQS
jgi:hypothetical protein